MPRPATLPDPGSADTPVRQVGAATPSAPYPEPRLPILGGERAAGPGRLVGSPPAERCWRRPPAEPTLHKGDVHVWRARLDVSPQELEALAQTLTGDERRTTSLLAEPVGRRAIASRGFLRLLLSRYLDRAPAEIRLVYGTCGRPALAGDVSSALDFNVSHSRDVALYAVAGGYRVGIDIECLEAATDVDAIAERYLSAAHAARVRRRSGSAKSVTFLKCWTLAEAILKCTGDGLGGLSWPEGDRVLDSETMPPGAWSVRRLVPWPGYVATLVLQGRLRRLFRWDYSNGNQAGS